MTLREALHAHIPTLTTQSTVRDAVDKMNLYQFPALVLVDDNEMPIGVITEGDVCRAVNARGSVTSIAMEHAIDFATREPTLGTIDMEISDAFHLMLMSGLTVLPVVHEDRLHGVVMRVDLMQAMMMDSIPD